MPRILTRLLAGFLLLAIGGALALAGPPPALGVLATADALDQPGMTPIGGSTLFPPSPHHAGDQVLVVQWCDQAAHMQAVVDRHAAAGQAAANQLYLALVDRALCHVLPAATMKTGTLVAQHGFAFAFITIPFIERDERAVVEVWSATVEGIEGRAVFITLAHWIGSEIDEAI